MLRQFLFCFLLAGLLASNEVVLTEYQTNITVGDNSSSVPINSISSTADGTLLLTAIGQKLTLLQKDSGGFFSTSSSLSLSETIIDAKFKGDGSVFAAIGSTSSNLYIITGNKPTPSSYALSQTIALGSQPTSLSWSRNWQRLVVGTKNGSVQTFAYNASAGADNAYYQAQLINTSHTYVSAVSAGYSRFATCGQADQIALVYYYNPYSGLYVLNQTIPGITGAGCSTIDFSVLENRIAIGRTNGSVVLLQRDNNFIYSVSNNISAHISSATFAKWTDDSVYLLTAGAANDPTIKLWTAANNYAAFISMSPTINGQSAQYNPTLAKYVIGTYGNAAGKIVIDNLVATNCTTSTTSANQQACTCVSGQIWQGGNCSALSCSGLANSPGTVDLSTGTTCSCNSGWVYDSNLMACKKDCSSAVSTNSNGTSYEYNSCFCVTGYRWEYSQTSCYIFCQGIAGALSNVNSTVCSCATSYFWSSTVCQINCTGKTNSPGSNASPLVCNCNTGYAWNSTNNSCWVGCAGLTGSNGSNVDSSTCNCTSNFYWSSANMNCTLNCSSAPNSPKTNASLTSCNCNSGYVWNTTLSNCVVNCSNLTNSNNTNSDINNCYCNANFFYLNSTCTVALNCTQIVNSNGTNADSNTCYCNSGYVFRYVALRPNASYCELDCRQYDHVDPSTNKGPYLTTCPCAQGYNWTGSSCIVTCSTMRYSTHGVKDSSTCYCMKHYKWDKVIGQCVAVTTDSSQTAGIVIGIILGILALIGIILGVFYCLKKKKAQSPVSVPAASSDAAPTSGVIQTEDVLVPQYQNNYRPSGSRVEAPVDTYARTAQPAYKTVDPPAYLQPTVATMAPATSYSNQQLSGSQAGNSPNVRTSQVNDQGAYSGPRVFQRQDTRDSQGGRQSEPYAGNAYQFSGGPRDSQAGEQTVKAGPKMN